MGLGEGVWRGFGGGLGGQFRDIPAKSRGVPAKSLVSFGFEGHAELFWPRPVHTSGQKSLGLGPFSGLNDFNS